MSDFFKTLELLSKQFNFKFNPKGDSKVQTQPKDPKKFDLGSFFSFKPFVRAKNIQNRIVLWLDRAFEENRTLIHLNRKETLVLIWQLFKSLFKSLWHWNVPKEKDQQNEA